MKILVLQGGNSDERTISLRSAKSVGVALAKSGHKVFKYDPAKGMDGVKEFKGRVDVVFPILHGAEGEDGAIQAKLEQFGYKYLGANSRVSKLCFDKVAFKRAANKIGILMPKGEVITSTSFKKSEYIKKPYVLKPIDGGSSIDTFIVRNPKKLPAGAEKALKIHKRMLIEELIEGIEISVPVLGKKALPVLEIIPPADGEFDYENKYNGQTQELCPPQNVSKELQNQAQKIAEQVHNGLSVRHLSRTDFIITPKNEIYTLEINTIPGMTDQSLFPKAAKIAGISMEQLMSKFLEYSLKN